MATNYTCGPYKWTPQFEDDLEAFSKLGQKLFARAKAKIADFEDCKENLNVYHLVNTSGGFCFKINNSYRVIGRIIDEKNVLLFIGHKNKSEKFVARMVRGLA